MGYKCFKLSWGSFAGGVSIFVFYWINTDRKSAQLDRTVVLGQESVAAGPV